MKRIKLSLIVISVTSLLLTGCGTALYEMTPEEENIIVHSAAYFVAKHNIQQKDGVNNVVIPENLGEEPETETIEGTESTESTEADNPEGSGNADAPNEDPNAVEMAEVIGHQDDLSVVYDGFEVKSSFEDGGVYFIDAPAGKTYFVMKFKVTNTSEADVYMDNISSKLDFYLVSEEVNVKSEWTALSNDFSTYCGTIPAGQTVDTVILFELSEAEAAAITAPSLQISIDNVKKSIKL